MTAIDKLLNRFKKKPKDFSYTELKKLLKSYGYIEKQGAGSRVVFVDKKTNTNINPI